MPLKPKKYRSKSFVPLRQAEREPMPDAPLKPCRKPGCPALVRERLYCDEHTKARDRERRATPKKQADQAFFNTRAWKMVRRKVLVRDLYTCQECKRLKPVGLEVHHKESREKRPDLSLVLANLVSLCKPCHSRVEPRLGMNQRTQRQGKHMSQYKRIVVAGPPASGKTTWCNHQRCKGDLVWDFDAVLASLMGEPDQHKHPGELIQLAVSMRTALVTWLAGNEVHRDVYVIVGDVTQANGVAMELGATVHVMNTDKETCLARLRQRSALQHSVDGVNQWFRQYGLQYGDMPSKS